MRQAWEVLHPTEPLEWNWHLQVICDHTQALAESLFRARTDPNYEMPDQNALYNVPPRSLKTEQLGIFFPAWVWLHDPSVHVRYVSGNDRVRKTASQGNRDLITSDWYVNSFRPKWKIRADSDNIGQADNTAKGRIYYSTYEQKVTGEGTDIIIIDDPIDAAEADSDVVRTQVNDKWDRALSNRVKHEKRCLRIGIMQRLHEDDWSGHVLKSGNFRHVCIPAEYEIERECKCADCRAGGVSFLGPYDPRTKEGELLHAERFGPKQIAAAKQKGSYYYAGQYQQRPSPAEGGMFKKSWWGTFDPGDLPSFRRVMLFADLAFKKTATGSRTAMIVVGELREKRYFLDAYAGRIDAAEMIRQIAKMRAKWEPVQPIRTVVIEAKAAGDPIVSVMKKEGVAGLVLWDPKNDSKESRAAAIVGEVEAGDVLLPRGASWKDDFIHELAVFPNGSYDDFVDVTSMALNYIRGNAALRRLKL